MTRFTHWALPGLVFSGMLAFSACSDALPASEKTRSMYFMKSGRASAVPE